MHIRIPENQRNRVDLISWVKRNVVNGEYVIAMCRECGLIFPGAARDAAERKSRDYHCRSAYYAEGKYA